MDKKVIIKENTLNNSVYRVFNIIETLSKYPNGCSLSILAKETGLNKSTIYRFLSTLSKLGYVINEGMPESDYRLTFKFVNIGQILIHETNIVQISLPHLTKLRNETGETVNLKLFQKDHGVLLFKLEPIVGNFRTRTYMGQSIPLYCSASGKTFLAFRDKDVAISYWEQHKPSIKKITENTIIQLKKFLNNLQQIKQNGYAIDHEENEIGISCIAAPIFDVHGDVNYAISVSIQTAKFDKVGKEKYLLPLIETAKNISCSLGYIYDTQYC